MNEVFKMKYQVSVYEETYITLFIFLLIGLLCIGILAWFMT